MKKLFSLALLAMMMVTGKAFAQGSLLATLSHEGNISAFYGADALKSALTAAKDGDIITLSSGQFNAGNITKAVTLRGAGMSLNADSLNGHEATLIQNDFSITLTDSPQGRLIMEGLYMKGGVTYGGTIKNAQFLKCRFKNFIAGSNAVMTNATFIHCRVYYNVDFGANSSAFFINSLICGPRNVYSSTNLEFDNCFVKWDYNNIYNEGSFASGVLNAYYKNCILQQVGYSGAYIDSSCTAYNCVGLGSSSLFQNMITSNTTNKYVSQISNVFKSYKETNNSTYLQDHYTFELTETAAKTYLGMDGTQVGVYGGNLLYDENPTIPQITKCNVAAKSTADGKLSVDIEVKAAEY